jgi:hypothetical protein
MNMDGQHDRANARSGRDLKRSGTPGGRATRGRIKQLSMLLVASTVAFAAWRIPVAAETKDNRVLGSMGRQEDAQPRDAKTAHADGALAVPAPEPSAAHSAPVALAKRKVRATERMVRDANLLLPQQPKLAKEMFELAIRLEPSNPHAHAGLAEALLRLGRPVEAESAATAALLIRPKRAAYQALVQAALEAQRGAAAAR